MATYRIEPETIYNVVPGLPVNLTLVIEGVPASASGISFSYNVGGGGVSVFRNWLFIEGEVGNRQSVVRRGAFGGAIRVPLAGVPPRGGFGTFYFYGSGVVDFGPANMRSRITAFRGGPSVTFNLSPDAPPVTDGGGGDLSGASALSWFQARAEGYAGAKIRRAGWANRYLERTLGIWWVQFFSPTTKSLGERRVVRATDFLEPDFRALDWTLGGIVGQSPTAGTVYQGVPADLRFP